jgi:copper chaperone CopZ
MDEEVSLEPGQAKVYYNPGKIDIGDLKVIIVKGGYKV